MLPDLRFVIGAGLATAVLGVAAIGVSASVRLAFQAQIGPIETSRTLAFADHSEWNQFYDADNARRFEGMLQNASLSSKGDVATPPADGTDKAAARVEASVPPPIAGDEAIRTGSITPAASGAPVSDGAAGTPPAQPQVGNRAPPKATPAARKAAPKQARKAKIRKPRPRTAARRTTPPQAQTGFPVIQPTQATRTTQRNGTKDPFGAGMGN